MSYNSETTISAQDNTSSSASDIELDRSSDVPLGYPLSHTIMIASLVVIIMIVIVLGNLLIVVAIATDRQLKTIQNWFIASLAVADLSLGIVIMPFSLANELMGYWYFGPIWCDLWKAIDVLLCTASILSICLISLDRYWSITRALTYSRQRTSKRAAVMITAVWVLSAIVCVPPLIGWKNPLPVSKYPLCLLSSEIGYIISSSMGSFYIPAVIMVFVYFKIYQAAKKRARRGRKNKTIKHEEYVGGDSTNGETSKNKTNSPCKVNLLLSHDNQRKPSKLEIQNNLLLTSAVKRDSKTLFVSEDKEETTSTSWIHDKSPEHLRNNSMHPHVETTDIHGHDVIMEQKCLIQECKNGQTYTNQLKLGETVDKNASTECAYSAKTVSKSKNKFRKTKSKNSLQATNSFYEVPNVNEIERQKRKLAKARERRATIVLGLVMAAFIFCWFPFFTIYIVTSLCNSCIPEIIFTIAFWAGYCNSALNPIIYTIFNQDFRNAFRKIIFKKCCA